MTPTMLISYLVIVLVVICWQCKYQAKQFAANKSISHWGKAAVYTFICAGPIIAWLWGRWEHWEIAWKLGAILVTERLALFDLILNALRKNKWYYVGRGTTGSIQSKLEGELSDFGVKCLRIFFGLLLIANIIIDIKI